jgi:subtilisin family serine protease
MSYASRKARSLLALLSIALLLLLSLAPTQAARQTSEQTGRATTATDSAASPDSTSALYIIRLKGEPLATAGVASYRSTGAGLRARVKPDFTSAAAQTYKARLAKQRQSVLGLIQQNIGKSVTPVTVYDTVLNGMAVQLTGAQAAQIAKLPGVVSVEREKFYTLDTDYGPQWIGADKIWDGSYTSPASSAYKGEGVVVGIIDSGINTTHGSFAATGADGYTHTNPLGAGKYKGACDPTNTPTLAQGNPSGYNPAIICNDKLIGTWTFTRTFEVGSPTGEPSPNDSDGHGTHTASTVAGNVYLNATVNGAVFPRISGVAPHANIIAYDVCGYKTAAGTPSASCPGVAILSAIEQATEDQVDVINMSISGGVDPWGDDAELAFLAARAAGIVVAVSAGNDGPAVGSVNHVSPWLLSVAATTHNRQLVNTVINISSTDGMTLTKLTGLGLTGPLTVSAPLVYAGTLGFPLCGTGSASNATNPFPAGSLTGKILICDRGTYGRVQKAEFAQAAGAVGYILTNTSSSQSLNADPFPIPGVHLSSASGAQLKSWIAAHPNPTAQISGFVADTSPSNGDILAGFSSLGPSPFEDILKPDIAAPGVDIIAAYENTGAGDEFNILSGTSMASPHTAGSAALIVGLHPTWTPGQVQSALTTTSKSAVTKASGSGSTTPFESGAGRVQVNAAANAGLVLDETPANFSAADPLSGGDPRTLNIPSFADPACVQTCVWVRTVKSTLGSAATWTASTSAVSGTITVTPPVFTIQPGATQTITVSYNLAGVPINGKYIFASVSLSAGGSVPDAHFPIAVRPTASSLQSKEVTAETTSTFNYKLPIKTIAYTNLNITKYGLVKGTPAVLNLAETEEYTTTVTVPAGTARLVAEIARSTSQDIDLYIYKDNGDGSLDTTADTQVCASATGAVFEYCNVTGPSAGTYFVRMLNFAASSGGAEDPTKLVTAVVPSTSSGNFDVTGPTTSAGGEAELTVTVNEPTSVVGDNWYGWFKLTDTTTSQSLGSTSFDFHHISDAPSTVTLPGGGTSQNISINKAQGTPLSVVVKDANGKPVEGTQVVFSAPTTGASAIIIAPLNPLTIQGNSNPSIGSAITDATGTATVWAKSNGLSGTYTITATVKTAAGDKAVTFTVVNQQLLYVPQVLKR